MQKQKNTQPIEQFTDLSPKEVRDAFKEDTGRILGNIQRIMTSKNIIQRELASRINSEESHISRMFKNKHGLTIKVLGRIRLALGVSLKELAQ